jgi:hypothetical protein
MASKSTPEKQGNKDWTDFFPARGGGVLQELFDDPLDTNDEIIMSYLLDGQIAGCNKDIPIQLDPHPWASQDGPSVPQLLRYRGKTSG